jgi:hypothetical protein
MGWKYGRAKREGGKTAEARRKQKITSQTKGEDGKRPHNPAQI